jgi:hypothetical protein
MHAISTLHAQKKSNYFYHGLLTLIYKYIFYYGYHLLLSLHTHREMYYLQAIALRCREYAKIQRLNIEKYTRKRFLRDHLLWPFSILHFEFDVDIHNPFTILLMCDSYRIHVKSFEP